jgi:hypothetical protein
MQLEPQILNGVIEKLCEWEKEGHKVILLTERKHCYRKQTEKELREFGIWYDNLVMDVTVGEKVLVDDFRLPEKSKPRAMYVKNMREFYQVSYPRSGSHLVAACAKNFLNIPQPRVHCVDSPMSTYVRMHFIPTWDNIEDRSLIVILRNPLDVFVRQNKITDEDVKSGNFKGLLDPKPDKPLENYCGVMTKIDYSYISIIEGYHNWGVKKIFWYYEDIMTYFRIFLEELGQFLDVGEEKIDQVVSNSEDIFMLNLVQYDQADSSETFGNVKIRHRDKLSHKSQQTIISYIKDTYPLASTYLERYL